MARGFAFVAGLVSLALFFALDESAQTMRIFFAPPIEAVRPGELTFWLGNILLATTSAFLLGYALHRPLGKLAQRVWQGAANLDQREQLLTIASLTVVYFSLARVGRLVFLRDLPITDDEHAVRFGGRLLARGELMAPIDLPGPAIPNIFLFQDGNQFTSFDFLGPQLFWALGELTYLEGHVYTMVAALTVAAVMTVVQIRHNFSWSLAAFVLCVASPMFFTLSMTTHSHVLSRGFIAIFLALVVWAELEWKARRWALAGLAWGVAFISRPPETLTLTLPILVYFAYCSVFRRDRGLSLVAFGLGALPLVAMMLGHNWAVTGDALTLPRTSRATLEAGFSTGSDPLGFLRDPGVLLRRLSNNVAQNLNMALVWFLGLLSVPLLVLGAFRDRFTLLLSAGVAMNLFGLGLIHDNYGIHSVGPIHQSEYAVPFLFICVSGLIGVAEYARRGRVDRGAVAALLVSFCVVALGSFTLWQGLALRKQSQPHARLYDLIDNADLPQGAIVLAPPMAYFWYHVPGTTASWVFEHRTMHPHFPVDEVNIVRWVPGAEDAARAAFPKRPLYAAWPVNGAPWNVLLPFEELPDRFKDQMYVPREELRR